MAPYLVVNCEFVVHSELAKFEEILEDYKRYKELLFKLSPPEWQEARRAKPLNKVLVYETTQNEQNMPPEESAIKHGKYFNKAFQDMTYCQYNGDICS